MVVMKPHALGALLKKVFIEKGLSYNFIATRAL